MHGVFGHFTEARPGRKRSSFGRKAVLLEIDCAGGGFSADFPVQRAIRDRPCR
jgi:hypothetical protein